MFDWDLIFVDGKQGKQRKFVYERVRLSSFSRAGVRIRLWNSSANLSCDTRYPILFSGTRSVIGSQFPTNSQLFPTHHASRLTRPKYIISPVPRVPRDTLTAVRTVCEVRGINIDKCLITNYRKVQAASPHWRCDIAHKQHILPMFKYVFMYCFYQMMVTQVWCIFINFISITRLMTDWNKMRFNPTWGKKKPNKKPKTIKDKARLISCARQNTVYLYSMTQWPIAFKRYGRRWVEVRGGEIMCGTREWREWWEWWEWPRVVRSSSISLPRAPPR